MPESVCSKPAVPRGQPVFSVPGAPSVFHRAARKVWKSLHAAAFYSPGSPPHSASRQHWGQLIWLISPLASSAPPRGGAAPGKPPSSEKPRHSLWNAGNFSVPLRWATCRRSAFSFHSNCRRRWKTLPVRAFAGRRRSAHRPACFRSTAARRRTAPDKPPHRKIPGTRSGMPGIFYLFTAAVPGVTSARRSHGLPL